MQRRQRDNLGVLLLIQHLIFTIGIENIPPVTLGTIGLQLAIFLGLIKVPWRNLQDCCLSAYTIVERQEFYRIISSVIEHADSMHLYYNMASFAWKGIILEAVLGAPFFFYMLVVFSVLTGLLSIVIYYALAMLISQEFMFSCGIGFSGVIFALKVVLNRVYPDVHPTFGGFQVRVPGGMYVWFELVLLSLISPGVSFVGHLSGILVGFAYSAGLLQPIFDVFGVVMGYNPHRQWNRGAGDAYQAGANYNYTRRQPRNTGYERTYAFFQVPKMPPFLTLLTMTLLASVFFKDLLPKQVRWMYPYIAGNCLNSYLVLDAGRYASLMTAAVHTLNRLHLVYCLLTLYKVGSNVEGRLGTVSFAMLLTILTAACGLIYVALVRYVLVHAENVAGVYPYDMKYKCFMGPTAVLLGLKVIHSRLLPYANSSVLLLEIPGVRLVFILTVEVLVLHVLFPQAWLVGNVAGILAGLSYVVLL
ncbi:rhomboid domain-containing protein 1-like [Tropilaelaps mercedesae]|uniref:Rhomboid domain-containing protein 1-like n=1 Tax=Tropilaelaps mercedesae TaxID=418985 RepID=A0A1V9XDS7_9ACAR|nr:rhomboid domain-containing protein 1-like [Tropilaelaps mercedesae]